MTHAITPTDTLYGRAKQMETSVRELVVEYKDYIDVLAQYALHLDTKVANLGRPSPPACLGPPWQLDWAPLLDPRDGVESAPWPVHELKYATSPVRCEFDRVVCNS